MASSVSAYRPGVDTAACETDACALPHAELQQLMTENLSARRERVAYASSWNSSIDVPRGDDSEGDPWMTRLTNDRQPSRGTAGPRGGCRNASRWRRGRRASTRRRIVLYWNGKDKNGLTRSHACQGEPCEAVPVRGLLVEITGELGGTNPTSLAELHRLEQDVDVAVCTSADCGSCTSWRTRDLCELDGGTPRSATPRRSSTKMLWFSLKTFGARGLSIDRPGVLFEQYRQTRSLTWSTTRWTSSIAS